MPAGGEQCAHSAGEFFRLSLGASRTLGPLKAGDVHRLGDVQFTGLPVFSGAAVVIDTVGEVGALLDLGDENARANGVERAGLDEKHVAAMNPRLSGGYLFHFSYYIIL
jgi:hypothetical protein